ncbi:hypothetical protein ES332_A13G006400v1 [Gossypium tomentosum]|uniref:Uncharacterized protein n=1 Tax=Gossypium tomentosum TaxID=34277 RepID=A0A5D2MEP9_GOSTO|nr:hypothetical protein ES332_A13G006400v1 [Gossypium tomentosum]
MSSDNCNSHELQPQKGFQIKQDDKFFTRLMSKETSMANSSCRIYYGGASVAVPFMWESQPGTPKHTFRDNVLPPLTPLPSYRASFESKSKRKKSLKPTLLSSIFACLNYGATPSSSLANASMNRESSVHDCMDDDGEGMGSPTWTLCFGVKTRNVNELRGLFQG